MTTTDSRTPYLGHLQDTRPGSRRNLRETSTYSIKGVLFSSQEFLYGQKKFGKIQHLDDFTIFSNFFRSSKSEDYYQELQHDQTHENPSFTINTNFSSMQIERQEANVPYDFQKFQKTKLKNGKIKAESSSVSVWTMDCEDGLIILGCSNGTIEIWDTLSGQLKVYYTHNFHIHEFLLMHDFLPMFFFKSVYFLQF